jgi:hypothetical protein
VIVATTRGGKHQILKERCRSKDARGEPCEKEVEPDVPIGLF